MNTDIFRDPLPNFIFLDPVFSEDKDEEIYLKTRFINTCDAMIHGRKHGEMFGLAIGEFCWRNKPIITTTGLDNMQLDILGDKGIKYNNEQKLASIIYSC